MKSDFAMLLAARNPQSLYDAVKTAATLGVDLTEGKRQGWLVPRDGAIAFQVGYKGIEAIYQRLGVIKRVMVRTVHINDTFEWSGDDQEKPSHTADWFNEKSRGEMIGVYAISYFPDNSFQVMHESVEAIYRDHRDKSDSWKKEAARKYSPWLNHPRTMIEKTMIVIASKQWPAATQDQEKASAVLERLHEAETADYSVYKNDGALMVNELHAFIMASDCLGVYLLQKQADEEQVMSWWWWPDSPKGLKGQCKENAERMKDAGMVAYDRIKELAELETAEDHECIELFELLESAAQPTKKMLAADLGESLAARLGEMKKQIDA